MGVLALVALLQLLGVRLWLRRLVLRALDCEWHDGVRPRRAVEGDRHIEWRVESQAEAVGRALLETRREQV